MSGKALQGAIIDLAHTKGWKIAHFHNVTNARGFTMTPVAADGKGFPDLILVRERLIAAEIKGTGDTIREDQVKWAEWLAAAGVPCYLWTVKVWRSGEVERILQ